MSNNTQLPADVLDKKQLQDKALTYVNKGCWAMETHPDKTFYPGTGDAERYTHYINGLRDCATEYAIKTQQEQKVLVAYKKDHKINSDLLDTAITLLEKVASRHEAGLLPDQFIYQEIKTFLDGK